MAGFPGSFNPAGTSNSNAANAQFQKIVDDLTALQKTSTISSNAGTSGHDIPLANQTSFSSIIAAQNAVNRTAWVMSTTEWLSASPQRGIVWTANPSDITWNMAQRSTHSKNLFGTVMHVWPDNGRDTFFDELRLTLNLQSSNILPVRSKSAASGWVAPPGMGNFYDFMQLVDAPKLTSNGRANLVSIQYNSALFPQLTLLGMFDSSGIRFTDSSATPNQVSSWTADFIVYDTAPRLTSLSSGTQSNSSLLDLWFRQRVTNNAVPT
jgi:hypothetical protein